MERRWTRAALVAVAVLGAPLVILAITGDLDHAADDYWQICALEDRSYPGGPTPDNLFRFLSGDPDDTLAAMREGAVPWYADPEVKVDFARPLSTALMRLDHALFGTRAWLAKTHTLIWYALLVVLVARLFRRTLPPASAGLATFVFAVAGAHWQIVAWLAARNAVVTAVFAVGALLCHLRWRDGGGRRYLALSIVWFALGLAAGEAALGIVGYVIAFEALGRTGAVRDRALGAAPIAIIAVVWLALYKAGGYGTFASGAYLDPIREPLVFARELPSRLAAMTGMQYLGFPPDLWFLEPQTRTIAAAGGVIAGVMLAPLWVIAWRASEPRHRRALLAFAVAALLAAIPQAAGLLGARSLTLPSIGGSAVLAAALVAGWRWLRDGAGGRLSRAGGWAALGLFAAINLVVAPLSWLASDAVYIRADAQTTASAESLSFGDDEIIAVTLQAPDIFFERYFAFQRRVMGLTTPRRWYTLSVAPYAHRVTRLDERTIELAIVDGHMMTSPFELLFRRRDRPLEPGDRVEVGTFVAEVVAADDVGPTRVRFTFARSLDDPSLIVLAWRGRLEPIELPAIGDTLTLPYVPGPTKLL